MTATAAPARPSSIPPSGARVRRLRGSHVLIALLVLHVLLKALLYPRLAGAPLVGDEAAYVDGARALANLWRDLLSFSGPDRAELERNVVSSGWFMPGMSLLMAPLFVVVPDPGVELIRLYLGLVTTLLLVATVVSVRRVLGDVAAGAVVVLAGLVPMWVMFTFAAWGDLCAGLVVVVLTVRGIEIGRGLLAGRAPSVLVGVQVGLLAIAALYLRSSTKPLLAGLLVLAVLAALLLLRGAERRAERFRALRATGAAVLVFVALLLPWTVAATATFDTLVVTTTTVPTVTANTFGDREQVCYGPCDPDSTLWFSPLRYAREVGQVTGASEVEVLEQMSAYARTDVTAQSYADDVLDNLDRYLMEPAGYEDQLRSEGVGPDAVSRVVILWTDTLYFLALAAGLAVMLVVTRRSLDLQLRSVLLKLVTGTFLVQPFVHVGSSRYWTTFAPLLAIGAVFLWEVVRRRSDSAGPASPVVARVLTWTQVSLAVALVALYAVLRLLAGTG